MQDSEADRLYGRAHEAPGSEDGASESDPPSGADLPEGGAPSELESGGEGTNGEGSDVDDIFAGVSDDEDLEEGGYDSPGEGEDTQAVGRVVREALGGRGRRKGGRREEEVVDEAVPESQYSLSAGELQPLPLTVLFQVWFRLMPEPEGVLF